MRPIRLVMTSCVIFLAAGAFAQQPTPSAAPTSDTAVAAPPAHPVTVEQVRRMMTISHSADYMLKSMNAMIVQQKTTMPFLPAGFWTDFETEMLKVDWVTIATPVYQKYLSQEDAEKIIAFYSTEAGQRALDSSMAVMREMSTMGAEIGKQIGARIGEKYQKEIEENIRQAQQQKATQSPN
jgi:hypothetical protein